MVSGIHHLPIRETPLAIVDFETTGSVPGADRVVELAVAKLEPDGEPKMVFDTLVHPNRKVAASEIHGITDADVVDAPRFREIAGDLLEHLSGCVVAAYNVSFDIRFLEFELNQVNFGVLPPHFCVMSLRPMLDLGPRCTLEEACVEHGVESKPGHLAAVDVMATAKLLAKLLPVLEEKEVVTFGHLARRGLYKFTSSFDDDLLPDFSAWNLPTCENPISRWTNARQPEIDRMRWAMGSYWDSLRIALDDLVITEDELAHLEQKRAQLGLAPEQLRTLHARAFAGAMYEYTSDDWLDEEEVAKLQRLHACLARLGWAPGL